jgi:hypothetical protein
MANWIKFDGSEEHKRIIRLNEVIFKLKDGGENKYAPLSNVDSFLICEPHPHRDMIIEWANTGRPVYVKYKGHKEFVIDDTPVWYLNCEYSFDPPKEKIKYRVALMKACRVEAYSEEAASMVLHSDDFIKWLTDWQEVKIDE